MNFTRPIINLKKTNAIAFARSQGGYSARLRNNNMQFMKTSFELCFGLDERFFSIFAADHDTDAWLYFVRGTVCGCNYSNKMLSYRRETALQGAL